jgi:hypothetical protein
MPLTQLEAELRLIARELMAKGQLPQKAPSKMWGGPGTGRVCALCGKPIQPGELEYELEGHIDGAVQSFRFHLVCESVWQLECARADHLSARKRPIESASE